MLGSALFILAIVNSIVDVRTLSTINFDRISKEIRTAIIEMNLDSNFLSFDEIPNELSSKSKTPSENQYSLKATVQPKEKFDEEGFLPLQIEIIEDVKKITPTPHIRIIPKRIMITSINLDAPIVNSKKDEITIDKKQFSQWFAPDEFAVGWQTESASLGTVGNTVLIGHHNVHGEVFKNLENAKEGDRIIIYGNSDERFTYIITNFMILPERDVSLEQRLDNAKWMLGSQDERITLITCWPHNSNTHRLVIVARPEIINFKEIIH